jgi:predicted ATPase
MFTRIQTRSFRCLKSVDQTLGRFCALVGPNASGKTTFLDVIALLGDLVKNRGDVLRSIQQRSSDFQKLLWMGQGKSFQLAVEAEIPETVRKAMADEKQQFTHVRYEVEIAMDDKRNEIGLNHETLWLKTVDKNPVFLQPEIFPAEQLEKASIFCHSGKGLQVAMNKKIGGNDNYYPDGKKKTFKPSYKLGWKTSALASIPADMESFPVSTWFRGLLENGISPFVLDSLLMRKPSPPGLGRQFQTDGSNLPWVIDELRHDQKRFRAWLDHVCTALEDIKDIDTVELPENKHRYLVVEYKNGARVPSWLVSDGTLRLLTLTIPAYLDLEGTFLIEEPENGIHPRAIETVLQSLSSVRRGQVLVATHSPVALNMLKPSDVLCFAKDSQGATDIVSGDRHPALRNWKKGEPDLGMLFASGILS